MQNTKSIISVLSDLDGLTIELDDIRNVLSLYDELFTTETSRVSDAVFQARLPMIQSTLNMVRFRLDAVLGEMEQAVAAGLAIQSKP